MNLKMKSYKGGDLKGLWLFTRKLDGVCVILDGPSRTAMSKRGKPLYNFEEIFDDFPEIKGTFEVFRTNWETTVSLVRTQKSINKVGLLDLNALDITAPHLRLVLLFEPTEKLITTMLKERIGLGEEGLVLVPCKIGSMEPQWEAKRIKVKDAITIDIRVTGMTEGKGKYKCMLGAFTTDYGNVSGMSDDQRYNFFTDDMVGEIIEVSFMEWTKAKKMRHPRFKRVRWDKQTENLER